ncbi:RHS repeat domain-containing protein [Pseudomonas putida]
MRSPGSKGQEVDTRYTYPTDPDNPVENNFLGFGLDISWDKNQGQDALYQYIGEYSYGTVEAIYQDEKPVRTIERRFNQFHLQTLEKMTQGDNVVQVVTEFELYKNEPFRYQPSTCHLPIHTTRTWWHKTSSSLSRMEKASYTYDPQGNVKTYRKANGVEEISNWWPANADPDGNHPEDAEGFVRHLKDKTIKPAPLEGTGGKNAAPLVQRYNYLAIPVLNAKGLPDMQHCHLLANETLYELVNGVEQEIEKTVHTQTNDADDPLRHGRLQMRTVTRDNRFTITTYAYDKQVEDGIVETQESTTGFDGASATVLRHQALLTGHVCLQQNADGVQTTFERDAMGRTTREVVAPGTEHEAARNWCYYLDSNQPVNERQRAATEPPGQEMTDEHGVKTRTYVDGFARTKSTARDKVDAEVPARFFEQYAAAYDTLGNLVKETEYDLLGASFAAEKRTLITRYAYDNWGQRCLTVGPDGVEQHEQTDPIGGTARKGPVISQWQQDPQNGKVSGKSQTHMNLFEKPTLIQRLDAKGVVLAEASNRYDGLGRCLEAVDERRNSTLFTYDARDRILSTKLPDSTLLERTYAAHSSDDLPATLTVTPEGKAAAKKTIITQAFDGLDRLLSREVGKRLESYPYEGPHTKPTSRTTPAGAVITYDYAINLSQLPTLSSATDDKADFAYHPISAALKTSTNGQGTRTYLYNLSNQLTSEQWRADGSEKIWTTTHTYSLAGLPLTRTDANEVGISHTYDAQARLKTSTQGLVEVEYEYDGLGRVEKMTTQDNARGGATQVTRLQYDDQGRETHRYQSINDIERLLFQIWGDDDLLKTRTLSENGVT